MKKLVRTLSLLAPTSLACCASAPDGAAPPTPTVVAPASAPSPPTPLKISPARPPGVDNTGFSLMWQDEFDGDRIDPAKWYVSNGYKGHGTVSSAFSSDCVEVSGGMLRMHVKRTPGAEYPYATGRIDSYKRFATDHGRVEIRARFPYAPGAWYAIWARSEANPLPELDIEVLDTDGGCRAWFVNHWDEKPLPADQRRRYARVDDVDPSQFHVYTVTWMPGIVAWAVDGAIYLRATDVGVPVAPLFWTINGWTGGWGGQPSPDLALPVTFEIDYFRYYAAPLAKVH